MLKSLLMALVAGAFAIAPVAAKAEDHSGMVAPAADATPAEAAASAATETAEDGAVVANPASAPTEAAPATTEETPAAEGHDAH